MPRINLLPWREEYRQAKKREFFEVAAVVLVLGAIATFLWSQVISARIDNQSSRNELLNREIAALEIQVKEIAELKEKKLKMLERMEVIQQLQTNRPDVVKVFDELTVKTPDGVFFTELKRAKDSIALTGYAESNNRVSALMRSLDDSFKFTSPNLTKVEADERLGEQGNRFEMRVKITDPAEPASADVAGESSDGQ